MRIMCKRCAVCKIYEETNTKVAYIDILDQVLVDVVALLVSLESIGLRAA